MGKVAQLPVELCGWEHYGYMTGNAARNIVARAVKATRDYKEMLKQRAQPPGEVEATVEWAVDEWAQATEFQFIPRMVIEHITRTMTENAITEHLD
jgi:phosphoserine phosphatase